MLDALEIASAIRDRRAELGLTQAQLAQRAHVSKRCLWSLESAQNPGVQLDKLLAVLRALELDLALTASGAPASSHDDGARALPASVREGAPSPLASLPDDPSDARWHRKDAGYDLLAILTEQRR